MKFVIVELDFTEAQTLAVIVLECVMELVSLLGSLETVHFLLEYLKLRLLFLLLLTLLLILLQKYLPFPVKKPFKRQFPVFNLTFVQKLINLLPRQADLTLSSTLDTLRVILPIGRFPYLLL